MEVLSDFTASNGYVRIDSANLVNKKNVSDDVDITFILQ